MFPDQHATRPLRGRCRRWRRPCQCGDDQSACCAARPWRIPGHGVSAHRARRTGRPSRGRSAGRRIVCDPHPLQATLIPLVGAVIIMGHRSSSAAPGRARVRVQACEALAAHRRGDRPHTHIHARARQSMADARSPIGAARDLVFPGHRLIQTPAHQRTFTPVGRSVFPRVIACTRDTQDLGHQGD